MTLQNAILKAVELIKKHGDDLDEVQVHCQNDKSTAYFKITPAENCEGYFSYATDCENPLDWLEMSSTRSFTFGKLSEILSDDWCVSAKKCEIISEV